MNCPNCKAVSILPFYDIRKPKRVRYILKDELYCPVCKSHMETNQEYMTAEQNAARQIGLPCVSGDGGIYKAAIAYHTTYVCKTCGHRL